MKSEDYKKAFGGCKFSYKKCSVPQGVEQGKGLEGITECYNNWLKFSVPYAPFGLEGYDLLYHDALREIKGVSYSLEDVSSFCNNLFYPPLYGMAGLYASAIVNGIIQDGNSISIKLKHFVWSFLGYRHSRGELIIDGYAGWYLGCRMSGGKIVVNGFMNAEDFAADNDPVPNHNAMERTGGEIWYDGKMVHPR